MFQLYREIDPNSTPTEWMALNVRGGIKAMLKAIREDHRTPGGYNRRHQIREIKTGRDVTTEVLGREE